MGARWTLASWQLTRMMIFDVYGGHEHVGAGTREDVEYMFARMGESDLFRKKGCKAVANRWFQATRRWREVQTCLSLYLYLITHMGMILGWWPTVNDSPMGRLQNGNSYQPEVRVDAPADGGEDVARDEGAADEPHRAPGVGGGGPIGPGCPDRGVAASAWQTEKFVVGRNALFVVAKFWGML